MEIRLHLSMMKNIGEISLFFSTTFPDFRSRNFPLEISIKIGCANLKILQFFLIFEKRWGYRPDLKVVAKLSIVTDHSDKIL
jgi:hypothetical protein